MTWTQLPTMASPLVCTYRYRRGLSSGRYVPVIHWSGGEYECGPALPSAADAIRFARDYAAAIRDALHSTRFEEAEARYGAS